MTEHTTSFDLVILDCDGVLVDSEIISCGLLSEMLSPLDAAYDPPFVMQRYLGRSAKIILEDYDRLSGGADLASFTARWRSRLFERFRTALVALPGVRRAVEGLGTDYCVASSSDEERIELCLRATGLWDLFEGRIFSTTRVERGKPAPDLFLLAAHERGVAPGRCLVVEDSVSGVTAGKAAGMTVFALTAGSHFDIIDQSEALLAAGADRILGSWGEFSAGGGR